MVRAGVDPPAGLGVSGDRDLHPFGVAAGLVGGRGVASGGGGGGGGVGAGPAGGGAGGGGGGGGGAGAGGASRFQIALNKCSSRLVFLLIRYPRRKFLHPEPHQTTSGV